MKHVLFFAFAMMLSFGALAQTGAGKTKPKEVYCMVLATQRIFSSKVKIVVDYGQEVKYWSFKDQSMKDDEGNIKNFNSVVDALNYMAGQGWEMVNAYPVSDSSGQVVLSYIMKKKL